MRDIIVPAYGIEHTFDAIERIVSSIPKKVSKELNADLYEELIFLNFAYHIIKKNEFESAAFSYQNL